MADPIAPLTEEEIDQLAIDIITNKVYFPQTSEDMKSAFMVPLALCPPDIIPPNATALYEEYSKAGPRSVNGRPSFFSGKFFPEESAEALDAALHTKALALGLIKE